MMRDCNTGIRWILNHTHFHGGDPSQVYLVGQSCGAQLAAITMITQVIYSLHLCQNRTGANCASRGAVLYPEVQRSRAHPRQRLCASHQTVR